ncbi:MAG: PTS sugar transporter subunit IIA [Ignavibacteria bacterium]|nr:PTS sugar transporter subunit IIA [Ignavibacteria bacterium]
MDIKFSELLRAECIRLNLEAKDKNDALTQMIEIVASTSGINDVQELSKVIFDREKLMSTGIGNGVALPHGKTNIVSGSVAAIATLADPIDFDSLDDKPVSIILLLVGTEGNVSMHLRLLSRISRMVGSDQFRTALLAANSVEDVVTLFASYEEERA